MEFIELKGASLLGRHPGTPGVQKSPGSTGAPIPEFIGAALQRAHGRNPQLIEVPAADDADVGADAVH
ncbi:MAG: hypothetical protein Ct9H300mP12_15100 [Acidimicrobiales bacterium]|nr:MAG: hypothetical protein Ct9H300mP12_15100 [Acidimicrobiales bacterium]